MNVKIFDLYVFLNGFHHRSVIFIRRDQKYRRSLSSKRIQFYSDLEFSFVYLLIHFRYTFTLYLGNH